HLAGGLCLWDAADEISGPPQNASASYCHGSGDQSPAVCGLARRDSSVKNAAVTLCEVGLGNLICQQYLELTPTTAPTPSPTLITLSATPGRGFEPILRWGSAHGSTPVRSVRHAQRVPPSPRFPAVA